MATEHEKRLCEAEKTSLSNYAMWIGYLFGFLMGIVTFTVHSWLFVVMLVVSALCGIFLFISMLGSVDELRKIRNSLEPN